MEKPIIGWPDTELPDEERTVISNWFKERLTGHMIEMQLTIKANQADSFVHLQHRLIEEAKRFCQMERKRPKYGYTSALRQWFNKRAKPKINKFFNKKTVPNTDKNPGGSY